MKKLKSFGVCDEIFEWIFGKFRRNLRKFWKNFSKSSISFVIVVLRAHPLAAATATSAPHIVLLLLGRGRRGVLWLMRVRRRHRVGAH